MAMAGRRLRGTARPQAEPDSPFDHHVYAICSDGDIQEGVSGEASSLAGTQRLGNLTLIYDANKISIEDDTDIALSEDVAARYEAYGWHVQVVDWTDGGDEYRENIQALYDAIQAAEAVTDRPSFIELRTIIAWPAPNARAPAPRTARPWARRRSPPPRRSSASTPSRPSRCRPASSSTPASCVERGSAAQAAWDEQRIERWTTRTPDDVALLMRLQTARLPDGWADDLPTFDADAKGVATRKASGKVINALAATAARAVGRLGRPGRLQQHHDRGRAVVHPRRTARPDSSPATRRRAGCCTSASASTRWARS